jgi:beta-glucosidase
MAVKVSGVGSVMCAYNKVNGIYACENSHLLNDILKSEWGFKGWVISDWGATHSTAQARTRDSTRSSMKRALFRECVEVGSREKRGHRGAD